MLTARRQPEDSCHDAGSPREAAKPQLSYSQDVLRLTSFVYGVAK
jgi:hypothetical protein